MPNYNNRKKYKCNNYPSCLPNNPQNNQGAPNSGNTNVPSWLITEKGLYSTTIKSAFNTHSRSASGNLQDKKGIFIFIGSEASKIGGVQGTLYTSAKHALYGFVKSFRKEANKAAVRATIINPGMVRTSFFNSLNFQPGKSRENALEASDIAELVYFLCQSSKYINFTDINVEPIKKVILRK